jgi:MFS family permease
VLLVDPVQESLGIADTEIALLQGAAFGLFYSVMGLPCGALVDRYDRRVVIAAGVLIWSVATVACGFAGSFWSLFLLRMLVGVGEATLSPGALALISDHFPAARRTLPISVYVSAGSLGSGFAMVAGGAAIAYLASRPVVIPGLPDAANWRAAFIVAGLPGLLIAALVLSVRKASTRPRGEAQPTPSDWSTAWRQLAAHRALYLGHFGAFALFGWLSYALLAWAPAVFIRVHGWSLSETGWRLGLTLLVAGPIGALLGGLYATRLRRRFTDGNLRTARAGLIGIVAPAVCAPLATNPQLALALFGIAIFFTAFPSGASAAAITESTPGQLRGKISAAYYLSMSVVGLICGPLSVALLTDYYFQAPERVGHSMALVAGLVGPLAALLLASALAPFRRLVERNIQGGAAARK